MAQVTLFFICAIHLWTVVGCVALMTIRNDVSMASVSGFVINASITGFSGWLFAKVFARNLKIFWLFVFLWADLVAYPFTNVLAMYGWYPQGPDMANDALLGAAIAEVLRYLWLLAIIAWLRFSKNAKPYLMSAIPAGAAPVEST